MTNNPISKEEEIFHAARAIASPEPRAAYLAQNCGDDAALRERIDALLTVFDAELTSAGLMSPGSAGSALFERLSELPQPAVEQPVGTLIGRFKLLERLGEGGFGVVFMAEQQFPVRRKVALKLIKAGLDTKQVIARFEAERQALAMMDHENIAKVLDAGATESGRPYFVMELVHGVPITSYCDENQLSPRDRLQLFVHVCDAVQHAHMKGVIHRDIKPTNVLVTSHDGMAVPKVIDFGVAKATGDQPLTDRTLFTQFAQMVGTPLYMSPEQAEMSALDVDTRSDVYSLGVLLYELLTGTTPFDKERLKQAAHDEVRRIIREEEPPRPSTRIGTMLGDKLATVSAHCKTGSKKLGQLVRGELDWIVMKALEKERTRRYETANSLARDVERYLKDEPVQAAPPTAAYRLRKLIRRNKLSFAAAAAVLLALVVGLTLATVGLMHAKRHSAIAQASVLRADSEAAKVRAEARNRQELGHTLWRLADALSQSGRGDSAREAVHTKQAEQVLHDALKLFGRAATEFPDEPYYRQELAYTHRKLGWFLQSRRRSEESEPHHRNAINGYTALVRDHPANAFYAQEAAYTAYFWGEHLKSTGRVVDANTEFLHAATMAEVSAQAAPRKPMPLQILGWARYRTGEWRASIEAMEKSNALQQDPPGGDAYQWIHLAMAHWQLGHRDEARRWHGKAVTFMDEKGWRQPDLRRFRAEAEALLGVKSPATAPHPTTAPATSG